MTYIRAPREFWIELGGDPSDDKECYKRYCAAAPFKPLSYAEEVVHLIEKWAYDQLLEELKKTEAKYASAVTVSEMFKKELDVLKSSQNDKQS
jgi:hypothetical protein